MLHYMRRASVVSDGAIRWGILTNGVRWRLYDAQARSVTEEFFELDLAQLMNLDGQGGLFQLSEAQRRHWLTVFYLVFSRAAFSPAGAGVGADAEADGRSFHEIAIAEGKSYEARVADDLSDKVFAQVFPALVQAVHAAAGEAGLEAGLEAVDMAQVREAALTILYRLLFILYAEDRALLPIHDPRYIDYDLRTRVREDIRRREAERDVYSTTATHYWGTITSLFHIIDRGDASIGMPAYNGGLFHGASHPLIDRIRLSDQTIRDLMLPLSFEQVPGEAGDLKYINYRNLSVQQLGSIYERLLEHEARFVEGHVVVRPNIFARKGSGSYYTPDALVQLILRETLDPLVARARQTFADALALADQQEAGGTARQAQLAVHDPAEAILRLKVCDPAMGSGHFLVALVDYLTDQVMDVLGQQAGETGEAYISPLVAQIATIRETIQANAAAHSWTLVDAHLEDRLLVRRLVLKRCVYGVDKNPMAVELAKVALWLHTFTVGAPLSFLDHHLRCGDSLFGAWVDAGIAQVKAYGSPLFLEGPISEALKAEDAMAAVEALSDAQMEEAKTSAQLYGQVAAKTAPLTALLSLIHALDWLNLKAKEDRAIVQAFFDGQYGDPLALAQNLIAVNQGARDGARFAEIWGQAQTLIREERFLHWQVAFPGVWENWQGRGRNGGFDAIIGNPPWDKMKLQQVEWFAERRPEIALAPRAADRKKKIAALEAANDPLAQDYAQARARAEAAALMARRKPAAGGDYPLLSGGDTNLYSLFVERALALVKPAGRIGLLVPSGIASDKTAADFFKGVATQGRLAVFYDFENRKVFFPDVHASFKFAVFVASAAPTPAAAKLAFFLHSVAELDDPERCFTLDAADFARVNPNTGTAPIFRTRRDAALTKALYSAAPILNEHAKGAAGKTWPVSYLRMFDMTNDSGLFRTQAELESVEQAWPIGGNRYDSAEGVWVPLYEGKMVQAYNHRAASVIINPENLNRPAQPEPASVEQLIDPAWLPKHRYWISTNEVPQVEEYTLVFKDVTASTNMRTMIASLISTAGFGNTLPVLRFDGGADIPHLKALLLANLNNVCYDYLARQKVQGNHLNWYIVEQLPVIPPARFEEGCFGDQTAGQIVRAAVLELTYTAHDMAPFARDMGYVEADGRIKPPFVWEEMRRLKLKAKLDAVFFHLYSLTDEADIDHIYATFPIVDREERAAHGRYLSRDYAKAYLRALKAGKPEADVQL